MRMRRIAGFCAGLTLAVGALVAVVAPSAGVDESQTEVLSGCGPLGGGFCYD